MQISFTEKKNVRKNFGKLRESLSIPNLIEVQKNSYNELTEFKTEKEYYTSYFDVFGDTCDSEKDKKRMWTDYGQNWDRQSLRKDFNPELTKSKVLYYNNKEVH